MRRRSVQPVLHPIPDPVEMATLSSGKTAEAMASGAEEAAIDSSKSNQDWAEDTNDLLEVAARYTEFEKNLTIPQSLKIFKRAVAWVFYAQLVIFGYGIDGVIAASLVAIPKFREDYGEPFNTGSSEVAYIVSAKWLSAWAGASQMTAILGAAAVGYIADKIGRKYTNLILCVISVAAVAVQYFSHGSLAIMTAGKAVNGLSIGGWLVLGPLYASEVAPLPLRGWLIALTNFVQFTGLFIFFGVLNKLGPLPTANSYKIAIALQWIIPCVVILTIYFFPESPVWLVSVGKRDRAIRSIEQIYGSDHRIDQPGLLAQIDVSHRRQRAESKESVTYADCFTKANRKRTLISVFIFTSLQFGGNIFVLGYQSYYFQLMGYSAQKSFMLNTLSFAFMWLATIASWPLMAYVGRRKIIILGSSWAALCLFIVGGASIASTHSAYLVIVCFMFFWVSISISNAVHYARNRTDHLSQAFVYQMTLGSVGFAAFLEVPTTRLRAKTTSLGNMSISLIQWVIGFTFPYLFNPDAANLGGRVGFIYGVMTAMVAVGHFFLLPETKDRTAAEIDILFQRGTKPREFSEEKVDLATEG
jgi:SP family general alpha glucoside:H+ symporter-like MFS transporter